MSRRMPAVFFPRRERCERNAVQMRTICGTILAAAMAVSNVGLANAKPMAELDAKGVVINGAEGKGRR